MASIKRKRDSEQADTKPAQKRPKPEDKSIVSKRKSDSGKENDEPVKDKFKPSSKSILVKEQQAFPRGGAGVLTPIERKQIHAQAVRDAAAEQNGSSDLFSAGHAPPDFSDDETAPMDAVSRESGEGRKEEEDKEVQTIEGR